VRRVSIYPIDRHLSRHKSDMPPKQQISIPERTFSRSQSPRKRKAKESSSENTEELKEQGHDLRKEITKARNRLKDHGSFDSAYVSMTEHPRLLLRYIAGADLKGTQILG
jgi:uncharacterized membrane protein YcaP (DUF421 family)